MFSLVSDGIFWRIRLACDISFVESNCATLRRTSMLRTVILVVLVLFLIGALPSWQYSANWGPWPSGGAGLLLLVVVILILLGHL